MHRQAGLFLNVYVDDFHMSGRASSFKTMWKKVKDALDIDEPVKFNGNIYLGCLQSDVDIDPNIVSNMQNSFGKYLSAPKMKSSTEEQQYPTEAAENFPNVLETPKGSPMTKKPNSNHTRIVHKDLIEMTCSGKNVAGKPGSIAMCMTSQKTC